MLCQPVVAQSGARERHIELTSKAQEPAVRWRGRAGAAAHSSPCHSTKRATHDEFADSNTAPERWSHRSSCASSGTPIGSRTLAARGTDD